LRKFNMGCERWTMSGEQQTFFYSLSHESENILCATDVAIDLIRKSRGDCA
jgi:hypothetical protein